MPDLRPEELILAEELIYNGKPDKALEIVVHFKKKSGITPKEQLWVLLLRGWVHVFKEQNKEAAEVGKQAYKSSKLLEMVSESAEALILKSYVEDQNKALELLSKAEVLLRSLPKKTNLYKITTLEIELILKQAWSYLGKREFNIALKLALKSLGLTEKIEQNINIAYTFLLLNSIYTWKGEQQTSIDYGMKSLTIMEELGFQIGIALSLAHLATSHISKGEYIKALELCEKSFTIREISKRTKVGILHSLSHINIQKGELDLALDNLTQAVQLAEEISSDLLLKSLLVVIGGIQIIKGNYDQAIKHFERCLMVSQKTGTLLQSYYANYFLFISYFLKDSNKQTLYYLENLRELTDQTHELRPFYLLAKAIMLKKSRLSRDRAEAERLLKQIVEGDTTIFVINRDAMIILCDYLFEELDESNDPEIIDEITPLIERFLQSAKNQNSIQDLAEATILQAKLALIRLDINEAKQLLVQAQFIAESHGLQLLARKTSSEHDKLLDQIEEWQALKRRKAKISDRIKFASIDDVISRLQGTRAVEPPELVEEEPVLLLIIAEGGIPVFSNLFTEKFSVEDGFISNFLTAFNTFSETVFSKGLDRAKFGEYILIMDSIGSFKVCYLFKGQSYAAKQKLIQLAHRVQNTPSIWRTFEDFNKTHQSIELKENPPLESLITEIFIKKRPEISTLP